ncbi:MAG: hypothetical protein KIT54_03845 [Phycisphaeraceae bacterium]|nr:hypothetical protein [Phycisphaeraceae bacterium]
MGLLAAILAWNSTRARTTVVAPPQPAHEPEPKGIDLVSVRKAGAEAVVEQTIASLARRVSKAAMPMGDELIADVGTIMHAWLGGSAEDYLAYLEKNGHEPPPVPLWSDPERRGKVWLDMTRWLREASFDPDGTFIRTTFADGKPVPNDQSRVTGWRFNKLPGLTDTPNPDQIAALDINIQEVLVPMRSRSLMHGADYNGFLALSYVQDPRFKAWTLVAVSVYDVPKNDTAIIPPF